MTTPMLWKIQPEAAAFVWRQIDDFVRSNSFIRNLRDRLLMGTGTRLLDWVAGLTLANTPEIEAELRRVGYHSVDINSLWHHHGGPLPTLESLWHHRDGMFPNIELTSYPERRLLVRVESVTDFVLAQGLTDVVTVEGEPLSAFRRAKVATENSTECWVIERHGGSQTNPAKVLQHHEAFRLRHRNFDNDADGFAHARVLIRRAIVDLGVDRACDLFFQAEREYWQLRNRAARVQKARQDALGMGWANHDHHTYRSSRASFATLISTLELMGFVCRERFYAGREAGWGAQVLEQPNVGVVIFADVDLSPDEVTGDFAHEQLPERRDLGTVGLWCALHGEAFLQAGMHHLECQFDFDAARDQLKPQGVDSMKPFTDFAFLRQAFTKGEVWPVAEKRIAKLLHDGRITEAQATKFRTDGALGSHLEILQRDDGYKGFNQTGINEIILKTDPRSANATTH